jgi:low affinity Fe/Cu permease
MIEIENMTAQTGNSEETHPHLKKTVDHLPIEHWYQKLNKKLAIGITNGVGTMWCAYIFCLISLTSLPTTLKLHSINADVQWVAQTFLQLVLLSVILVGQNISAVASDARSIQTYNDTEEMKTKLDKVMVKLDCQD